MDKTVLNEIMACLPRERTLFHYCRDRYAALLLHHFVGTGRRVGELKKSRAAGLLDKPSLRDYLAGLPDGLVTPRDLENFWPHPLESFILTVGHWGNSRRSRYYQTSRPGYNLVLQLNFSEKHGRRYRQLLESHLDYDWFNYGGHPVLRQGQRRYFRNTLAWARIDLDFHSNEALIEEVQNDWVRESISLLKNLGNANPDNGLVRSLSAYVNNVLVDYARIWDEAMLSAAIGFIHRELGIGNIYYHSWETGNRLKGLRGCTPPRSLYSRLPRRFCFEKVAELPDFLMRKRSVRRSLNKLPDPHCYKLSVH